MSYANKQTIFIFLANQGNALLLGDFLKEHYCLSSVNNKEIFSNSFDLCIVDGLNLSRYRQELQARVEAEYPVFLPVLLLTNRDNVKMVTANLWQIVDDVLITPIEKVELLARVENLLHVRRLSLQLKNAKMELSDSQKQIKKLQDELETYNKLFK